MNKQEWNRVKKIENEEEFKRLNVGEMFLYGQSMLNQKDIKEIGESISYYKVVSKNVKNGNIQYIVKIENLEEERL